MKSVLYLWYLRSNAVSETGCVDTVLVGFKDAEWAEKMKVGV